jgi:hypothetical protein
LTRQQHLKHDGVHTLVLDEACERSVEDDDLTASQRPRALLTYLPLASIHQHTWSFVATIVV